jgi:hypothetical protein
VPNTNRKVDIVSISYLAGEFKNGGMNMKKDSGKIKVLQFNPKVSESKDYTNTYQKAYYELFSKSEKQEYIIFKISKDIGGVFNLFCLPKDMAVELIGIGTLNVLQNDLVFKRHYAEKLAETLEYLQYAEDRRRKA